MIISGSVGRNGANDRGDARLIQHLLNNGGATLTVDGLVGPKTVQAIEQFQERSSLAKDGRVDPDGATLRALVGGFWTALNTGITPPPAITDNLTAPDESAFRTAFANLLQSLKT